MLTQQFRILYPQGSLISELVTIDRGKYIVRTLVQVEGCTLATALAAADTVEQAEDNARNRALSALALDSTTKAAPAAATGEPRLSKHSKSETTTPHPSHLPQGEGDRQKLKSETNKISSERPLTDFQPLPLESPKTTPETEQLTENVPLELEREFASKAGQTVDREDRSVMPASNSTWQEQKPQENYLNHANEMETDYSDVIAKTDFELQRLRWTKQQGVEHLVQTYGKRSRLTLSDAELLEFLHYLESLPTPV